MKASPRYVSINKFALGVALTTGAAMLTPSTGYAGVAEPQSCAEQTEIQHFGPPGKGFDQAVKRNRCEETEFAAFEATQTEDRKCPSTGRSPIVGLPAGKGFDYLFRIAKC